MCHRVQTWDVDMITDFLALLADTSAQTIAASDTKVSQHGLHEKAAAILTVLGHDTSNDSVAAFRRMIAASLQARGAGDLIHSSAPPIEAASLSLGDLLAASGASAPQPATEAVDPGAKEDSLPHKKTLVSRRAQHSAGVVASERICIEYTMDSGLVVYESRCIFKGNGPFSDLLDARVQAEARLDRHERFTADDGTWVVSKHVSSLRLIEKGDPILRHG